MEPWFLSIRKTLAYFDQFSEPLTATELWSFLWQPPPAITWSEFLTILDQAVLVKKITVKLGFYCLPGRETIITSRQRAQVLVEHKISIARRVAPILASVPGVEAIFICNTVAAGWPSAQSDIDLLVVVKPGRLWLTRFLFTIATIILTKHRHDHQVADQLCLSFFITRDQLNLAAVRGQSPDIYLIYWLQQLILLAGDSAVMSEIIKANQWTREYIPYGKTSDFGTKPLVEINFVGNFCKKIGELFYFNWLEKIARSIQKNRIDHKVHAPAPAVVISDSMLKFHESDRRDHYQQIWLETCQRLNSEL